MYQSSYVSPQSNGFKIRTYVRFVSCMLTIARQASISINLHMDLSKWTGTLSSRPGEWGGRPVVALRVRRTLWWWPELWAKQKHWSSNDTWPLSQTKKSEEYILSPTAVLRSTDGCLFSQPRKKFPRRQRSLCVDCAQTDLREKSLLPLHPCVSLIHYSFTLIHSCAPSTSISCEEAGRTRQNQV